MSFEIVITQPFRRAAKALAKKYRSLGSDLEQFIASLEVDPTQGVEIRPNCYKIRFTISSKGKGKSKGARVITFVEIFEEKVYLLLIYDKSDKADVSDRELNEILDEIH